MASILLDQVLNHIENNPGDWNQNFFAHDTACGTTFCLAGHALILSGEWEFARVHDDVTCREHESFVNVESGAVLPNYEFASIVGAAARVLDIPTELAHRLFLETIPCSHSVTTAVGECDHADEADCERLASLSDPAQFAAHVRKVVAEHEANA